MNINALKFFLSLSFFVGTLVALGLHYYDLEQQQINKEFNNSLQHAAASAQIVIGDRYHDKIMVTPPSEIEYAAIINTLTTLASTQNVLHIYSIARDPKGNLRYTSSSAKNNSEGQTNNKIYALCPPNNLILKALTSNQPLYSADETSDNKKGIRTIYVPSSTPSGYKYVIGVDIEANSINKLSNAAAFSSIGASLMIVLGILPLFFLYRNALMNINKELKKRIEAATDELYEINEGLDEKVREKTRQLTESFYHDSLTALPNRSKLQEDLTLSHLNTVAILNVDDFKEINDFFGIDAGDDILKQIASRLLEMNLKPYRIGGDEFAVLLPSDFSSKTVEEYISQLLHQFGEKAFIVKDDSFHLRATIGIAIKSNKPLLHADVALNKARANKKTYSIYNANEGIEERYKSNIAISAEIRDALIKHRIFCQYQPIVNTKTGLIEKYETLVRIQREDGSFIYPNTFLPIAQKTKLYPQITKEVITQACYAFSKRTEHFSINLASSDILDPETIATIEQIVKQTKTANRIVFEILESEGIENFDEVAAFITRMKKLGATIAIDDFGSGYSNFENILKLNIDFLKIDGSLIRNIDKNSRQRIVVESIVDFAHRIGIETIAEFVATEEILKIVTELGINYSQGYYTGKPQFLN